MADIVDELRELQQQAAEEHSRRWYYVAYVLERAIKTINRQRHEIERLKLGRDSTLKTWWRRLSSQ